MSKKPQYTIEPTGSRAEEIEQQAQTLNQPTPEEVKEEERINTPESQEVKAAESQVAKVEAPAQAVATPTQTVKPSAQAIRVNNDASHNKQVNRRVQTFEFQVAQYIKLCSGPILSEQQIKKKLYAFANIIRMIINSTDTAVFDAAYQFFKEYRNNILAEDLVFGYIHTIPTEQSIRMQTIYTTFRAMVESNVNKTRFALDYGLIRDNLKLPVQHPLLNWIRKKLGNNN